MALFRQIAYPPVDAILMPDGNMQWVQDGQIKTLAKDKFDLIYAAADSPLPNRPLK